MSDETTAHLLSGGYFGCWSAVLSSLAVGVNGKGEGRVKTGCLWFMEGHSQAERGHCAVKGREEERGQWVKLKHSSAPF